MYLATRHAVYSAALSTEATAPSCFFPHGIKGWPRVTTHRSTADSCTYVNSWTQYHQTKSNVVVHFWNNMQTPLPNTRDLQIIAIWRNTKGRNCLNACNKNWLNELAKETPEAKWEITFIIFYPSALSTEKTPGLYKVRKLPNGHLRRTPGGPQDKTSTYFGSLTEQPNRAPAQTWSVKYKIGGTGPTLMAVLKYTKKGKTQDQVDTTLA